MTSNCCVYQTPMCCNQYNPVQNPVRNPVRNPVQTPIGNKPYLAALGREKSNNTYKANTENNAGWGNWLNNKIGNMWNSNSVKNQGPVRSQRLQSDNLENDPIPEYNPSSVLPQLRYDNNGLMDIDTEPARSQRLQSDNLENNNTNSDLFSQPSEPGESVHDNKIGGKKKSMNKKKKKSMNKKKKKSMNKKKKKN